MKEIGIVTVENRELLDAIMREDVGSFWDSNKCDLICDELAKNGTMRRHPVHTQYVVDVVAGLVFSTVQTTTKPLAIFSSAQGYELVSIKSSPMYLGRFVMEAFLGRELPDDLAVHHYQYSPIKNSIYNLRLVSHKTNRNIPHKQWKKTSPRYRYYVERGGETIYVGSSRSNVARFLGTSKTAIQNAVEGKQKTVKGCTIQAEEV